MRGRAELGRVAPLLLLLLWFFLPLHRHGLQISPGPDLLGLRVLREEGIGAGRVPIWGHMPENLAAVVRIINMAADGRALAGDADLDGAPVCSYVWVLGSRDGVFARASYSLSRPSRGNFFFGTGCARLRYLGAPARGSLHGCYLGHGVGARALAVPAQE